MEKIILFFSSIRWQDILDVTLNAYILFRLYVLFRGTNAFRVLMTIGLLWFLQRISTSLGLVVTSWFVQGIIAVAALLIIIVFRTEIRAVLQSRNLRSIFWGFPQPSAQTPVEIIVEAVFEMAQRRIGSLVVLPGREDLSDATHGGIRWNGIVSKEMIESVFWPDNPVHDGAAVIEGGAVTEVGVILPLSHRQDLPSFYGTRHRAAAGLAEATDALAVVVSEERGAVSVAKGQEIRDVTGKEDLGRVLEQHLGISSPRNHGIVKDKLELGAAALVSFLFIAGVWVSFTHGQDTLMSLEVPVEYMGRDPGLEIIDRSVNTVLLELGGNLTLLRSIRPEQFKVQVDLSKGRAGLNHFTITPREVSLPPGISLRSVKPLVVDVTLDTLISKDLPVQVDWAGSMGRGLVLTQVKVSPERVRVTGPKETLSGITTLYTERVYVDKLEVSGSVEAEVLLSPGSIKLAPGARENVTVEFTVEEKIS